MNRLGIILACAFALAACDDDSATTENPNDMGAGGAGGTGGTGGVGGQGGAGGAVLDARELQVVGDSDVFVPTDGTAQLQVRLVGGASQTPIEGERITVTMFDEMGAEAPQGVEGSAFRGSNVTTGADGVATFELAAGPRQATFTVRATGGDATPAEWNVLVRTAGTGDLRVTVEYDPETNRYGYPDLVQARVDLFQVANADCDTLRLSAADLAGAFLSLPEIMPFNEVDNQVLANALEAGEQFNVTAVAQTASGNVVAFGCAPMATVPDGGIGDVNVQMTDLALRYKGRYAAVSRFDLGGMLRGTGDSTLETVADVLDVLAILGNGNGDRGAAMTRLFCDLANVDEGLCDVVSRVGGDAIDRLFTELVPQQFLDILTVLGDLATILTNLTVVGEIEFISDAPDLDGVLLGSDNRWQKYRFQWQGETRDFTIGDLDVDRRPVAGVFDAQLDGERLNIGAHSLNVRYGLIAVGLLEQWIFPRIVGSDMPVNTEEMLLSIIPCMSVNDTFGDPNSGLCEEVLIPALAQIVLEQLGELDFDAEEFVIEGSTVPLDDDGDLVIDTLSEGIWNGTLTVGGGAYEFEGCFSACRDMECPNICTLD